MNKKESKETVYLLFAFSKIEKWEYWSTTNIVICDSMIYYFSQIWKLQICKSIKGHFNS